jgi:hypothetical protein
MSQKNIQNIDQTLLGNRRILLGRQHKMYNPVWNKELISNTVIRKSEHSAKKLRHPFNMYNCEMNNTNHLVTKSGM